MLVKLLGTLAIALGFLVAGTATTAPAGEATVATGCCEGCPDCGCDKECCDNCADGCDCTCNS